MNRPPRFTLRTLFLLITAFAVALSLGLWFHKRGLRQRQAAEEVRRLGGGTLFDAQGKIPFSHFSYCVRSITLVNLANPRTRDDDLTILQEFPQAQRLALTSSAISDRAAPHIAKLRRLEWLWLEGTAITDESIPHLAQLRRLKILDLRQTAISDEGAEKLRTALPNCEVITHYMRRCRGCHEFYLTRQMNKPGNLCRACEQQAEE
jgi:hypothetical protein